MKRHKCILLTLISVVIASSVQAQTFTLIADTNTPAPGGINGGNFLGFNEPVIENGQIVFRGQDGNSNGFFSSDNGVLSRIVDSMTNVPGELVTFSNFSGTSERASLSNGQIAFSSLGSSSGGVYMANENNQIDSLIRFQDAVPGQNNITFISFAHQHTHNGRTVFRGAFGPFSSGIYFSEGQNTFKVIDSTDSTPIPGMNGDFISFTPAAIENGTILFVGGGFNTTTGLYQSTLEGVISVVADINTPIPDGDGNFTFFDNRFPNVDDGQVVFVGSGANNQSGIYLSDGNGLTTVADRNTLQPGSANPFSDLREPIIDNGRVFFQGNGTEGLGIYMFDSGQITRLVGIGDSINGQQLTTIAQNVMDADDGTVVFTGFL